MSSNIDDPEAVTEEPANLKFLRRLVTTLTAVMIAGVVLIVALLVIRLQTPPTTLALPDEIKMPDGTEATAFTRGSDWYAVVTSNNEILIFDSATSELMKRVEIRN